MRACATLPGPAVVGSLRFASKPGGAIFRLQLPVGTQRAQDFVRTPGRLLIDGEWVEAVSGKTFETLNPATEESLGWVAHGAAEDIDLAVSSTRWSRASRIWPGRSPSARG